MITTLAFFFFFSIFLHLFFLLNYNLQRILCKLPISYLCLMITALFISFLLFCSIFLPFSFLLSNCNLRYIKMNLCFSIYLFQMNPLPYFLPFVSLSFLLLSNYNLDGKNKPDLPVSMSTSPQWITFFSFLLLFFFLSYFLGGLSSFIFSHYYLRKITKLCPIFLFLRIYLSLMNFLLFFPLPLQLPFLLSYCKLMKYRKKKKRTTTFLLLKYNLPFPNEGYSYFRLCNATFLSLPYFSFIFVPYNFHHEITSFYNEP